MTYIKPRNGRVQVHGEMKSQTIAKHQHKAVCQISDPARLLCTPL